MAEYKNVLLAASDTSLLFGTPRIKVVGLKEVFLEVVVECTAANLICDFSVGTVNTLISGRALNMAAGGSVGTQICVNQPGYTLTGGYYLTINNPPIGTSKFHMRMSNPGKLMGTYHTYTSGGGDVKLTVNAWGWTKSTTP